MSDCVFIIAGEPSGDIFGGLLIKSLKNLLPTNTRFIGVGGEYMIKEGLESIFPIDDLSVMGILEVLPKIPLIIKRLNQSVKAIKTLKPKVIVTIDSPGFNNRLAKKIFHLGIPVIHYVAPSVWAWKPKRAKKISKFTTHLMTILPFEAPYFEKYGLKTTFVGHPVIEDENFKLPNEEEKNNFLIKYALDASEPILCMLPGSRKCEIERHAHIFLEAFRILSNEFPTLQAIVPTLPHLESIVRTYFDDYEPTVITSSKEKGICFHVSTAASAASGTVSLQLAMAGLPSITAYQINPVTAAIVQCMLTIPFVNLVNILLNKEVIPELIQEDCTPKKLSSALLPLLRKNSDERQIQQKAYKEVISLITPAKESNSPSLNAAKIIAKYFTKC